MDAIKAPHRRCSSVHRLRGECLLPRREQLRGGGCALREARSPRPDPIEIGEHLRAPLHDMAGHLPHHSQRDTGPDPDHNRRRPQVVKSEPRPAQPLDQRHPINRISKVRMVRPAPTVPPTAEQSSDAERPTSPGLSLHRIDDRYLPVSEADPGQIADFAVSPRPPPPVPSGPQGIPGTAPTTAIVIAAGIAVGKRLN